jgi:hypothetical protein
MPVDPREVVPVLGPHVIGGLVARVVERCRLHGTRVRPHHMVARDPGLLLRPRPHPEGHTDLIDPPQPLPHHRNQRGSGHALPRGRIPVELDGGPPRQTPTDQGVVQRGHPRGDHVHGFHVQVAGHRVTHFLGKCPENVRKPLNPGLCDPRNPAHVDLPFVGVSSYSRSTPTADPAATAAGSPR